MKRVITGITALLLVMCLVGCKTDMSVYESSDASSDSKDVPPSSWSTNEFKPLSLTKSSYRLVDDVDKPKDTILVLAKTAMDKSRYFLDGLTDDLDLKSKYVLESEFRETGMTATYADGAFTRYEIEDAVVGRYSDNKGDTPDMEMALTYNTGAVEDSYTSFVAVFRNMTSGGVSQADVYNMLCKAAPADIAEALTYYSDRDGLDINRQKVPQGSMFEQISIGGDVYYIGRDVSVEDGETSVQMYLALNDMGGDKSIFGEDTDWEKVSVFEHYDGGYAPRVTSLDDVLPERLAAEWSGLGNKRFDNNDAFDGLYACSVGKYGMTKHMSYDYCESSSAGGRVTTFESTWQDCTEDTANALTPYTSVKMMKTAGSGTVVTVFDSAGYSDDEGELGRLTAERIKLWTGDDVSFDGLSQSGSVSIGGIRARDGMDLSGVVSRETSNGLVSYPYVLTYVLE